MSAWLGEEVFNVTRAPEVIFEGGVARHADGAVEEVFSVSGVLRPLDDRTAAALPEGIRQRGRWRFYCRRADLRSYDVSTSTIPDVIEVDGVRLHFFGLANNSRAISGSALNHARYVLILEGAPPR